MTVHHVYANRSNVGDWLSARGIQRLLGLPVVEHLCDEPFVEETLAALAGIGDDDFVVLGGGGLLMDYFAPFWAGFLPLERRYAVWGAGLVDLKTEPTRLDDSLLRAIAQRAELCVVRDELSRAAMGVDAAPVPCPSLAALDPAPVAATSVLHVVNLTTVGSIEYRAMRRIARMFAAARGLTYEETSNRIEAGEEADLAGVLRRYRRAAVVLTSRLHGALIALAAGRPVLAVSGDRKIESFMSSAGLDDWVVDHGDLRSLGSRLAAAADHGPHPGIVDWASSANESVAARVRALAGAVAVA